MTPRNDVELGRLGLLALVALAAAVVIAFSCTRPPRPPLLWEICRDMCGAHGGVTAVVVGPVDPAKQPACMCAAQGPGT